MGVGEQVQDAMLQGMWSREVLALPKCGAASGAGSQILWYGPRVRMGIYEGEPTRVVPHSTSGRADYFGPLVNRCATSPHHQHEAPVQHEGLPSTSAQNMYVKCTCMMAQVFV